MVQINIFLCKNDIGQTLDMNVSIVSFTSHHIYRKLLSFVVQIKPLIMYASKNRHIVAWNKYCTLLSHPLSAPQSGVYHTLITHCPSLGDILFNHTTDRLFRFYLQDSGHIHICRDTH